MEKRTYSKKKIIKQHLYWTKSISKIKADIIFNVSEPIENTNLIYIH